MFGGGRDLPSSITVFNEVFVILLFITRIVTLLRRSLATLDSAALIDATIRA